MTRRPPRSTRTDTLFPFTTPCLSLVVGCGAIGLGVIAGLKLMGITPIIAADFDENRRNIALKMGADVVIDPRELSPYGPVHGLGNKRATLIYECVGKPGLLNQIMNSVGFGARIVVGGFCLEPEQRSTESRVGNASVRPCRSRGSPSNKK